MTKEEKLAKIEEIRVECYKETCQRLYELLDNPITMSDEYNKAIAYQKIYWIANGLKLESTDKIAKLIRG